MSKQQGYYQRFADDIIARIKDGTAPWQKPWQPGERWMPQNLASSRPYTAGNSLYLAVAAEERGFADHRWATYRQIKALGGHIRKGEHGEQVVFFARAKRLVERDQAGKPKLDAQGNRSYRTEPMTRPVWRTFTVFNAEQTAGLALDKASSNRPAWHPHRVAEAVLEASGVPIRHKPGDRAFYNLKRDEIVLPQRAQFPSADHYYQTALHELGHSTGHPDRMKRETLIEGIKTGFGSPAYAREELRAEIGAMMTGDRLGTGHDPARGAAYVEGWVQALEEDPHEIHRAGGGRAAHQQLCDRARQGQNRRARARDRRARPPTPTRARQGPRRHPGPPRAHTPTGRRRPPGLTPSRRDDARREGGA